MQRNSSDCGSKAARWWLPAADGLALPIDHSFHDGSGSLPCGEYQPLPWPLSRFGSLFRQSIIANDCSLDNNSGFQHDRQVQQRPTVLRRPSVIKKGVGCTGPVHSSSPIFFTITSNNSQSMNASGLRKISENCPSDISLGSDGCGSSDDSSSVDTAVEDECIRRDVQEFRAEFESRACESKFDFRCLPFDCDQCGKKFGKATQLARHICGHLGGKPYSCKVCQRTFSRIDHWKAHEGTHRGEKPFKCAWCPYAATRRDILTRHVRATGCGAN